MTCSQCNTKFCYICGKNISDVGCVPESSTRVALGEYCALIGGAGGLEGETLWRCPVQQAVANVNRAAANPRRYEHFREGQGRKGCAGRLFDNLGGQSSPSTALALP